MNRKKGIDWLYEELPVLEEAGIITGETAERLKAYYGEDGAFSKQFRILMMFGVLGAVSIALGIILLLAHNWEELSRPFRIVLSFLPLVVGQGLAIWTLLCRKESQAWRESSGAFWILSIGACISLISQTYHIEGNMSSFLLTWLLLGLPVIYLLRSSAAAILFMVGVILWSAVNYHKDDLLFLYYWPLVMSLIPHIYLINKREVNGRRTGWLQWSFCLMLVLTLFNILDGSYRGLTGVIYSALFCVFLLEGTKKSKSNVFTVMGYAGFLIIMLVFSYEDYWHNTGLSSVNVLKGYHASEIWQDFIVILLLLSLIVYDMIREKIRGNYFAIITGFMPLLALFALLLSQYDTVSFVAIFIINLYALIWGLVLIRGGIMKKDILVANAGMVVIVVFIVARFFDSDISYTIRGLLFIVLGTLFLGMNTILFRQKKADKEVSQ